MIPREDEWAFLRSLHSEDVRTLMALFPESEPLTEDEIEALYREHGGEA